AVGGARTRASRRRPEAANATGASSCPTRADPRGHFRSSRGGRGMAARVTSVFLYVKDVRRSLEFYNEVVGAQVIQVHAENENAPISLAILRIGQFTMMLHPQEPHAEQFDADTRVGVGIHLQLQVPDVDAFHQHCLDEGAFFSVSGEPTDQSW